MTTMQNYATAEITPTMAAFADWLIDEVFGGELPNAFPVGAGGGAHKEGSPDAQDIPALKGRGGMQVGQLAVWL